MQASNPLDSIFERNLRTLGRQSPAAARAVLGSAPRADVEFVAAGDGAWTIRLGDRLLASLHEPLREARVLADQAPVESSACIAVLGFGAGHHLAALADRIRKTGVLLVFEPDVALLRTVLEREDHTSWMSRTNIVLLTSDDASTVNSSISGMEGLLAAGVKILDHPPSRARLGESGARFTESLTRVMRAVKTNVITTFVQVETTLRNFLMNIDRYATVPGIADLAGAGSGSPAVVVSAGPSLERNIDLLARPGVRDCVVIIAAQTVLKKLLARGIKPHFVTALDHHEISRRFYEGLTAADVEGITLIVEPKANPAIMSAYPGMVRCPGEKILDDVLGPELGRPMGAITPGATVAHLAYYLGRHLGCDPVILIGQDLGFTDGQYYHAGAAIHQVWAGELNEFNTLEMLEWQRIVRSRHILHRASDHLGRPIYTDEQMATYLVQFERDFAADEARGLTTIDATEGGVAKRHTAVLPLREALERFGRGGQLRLPATPAPIDTRQRREQLRARLADIRRDAWKISQLSRRTADRLADMLKDHADQRRVGALIEQAHGMRDEVVGLQPAYGLVSFLNQTGGFKRFQADRAIELDQSLSAIDRQRRQIERDITNVVWIADAADQLGRMLDDTLRMVDGAPRITRDAASEAPAAVDAAGAGGLRSRLRCIAVIPCFACPPGLMEAPVKDGASGLELTLTRLAHCRELDGVLLVRDTAGIAERIVGNLPREMRDRLGIVWADADPAGIEWWRTAYQVRRWSEHCWRGGPGNLTIWDELWRPASLARLMEARRIDAAVLLGPQWCCIDPGITDAIILRHRENPEQHPLTFSPTAPGFAPCVIGRELAAQLGEREATARMFATIGGVLGYVPALPRHDPIAKPPCIDAPIELRDAGRRAIADTAAGLAAARAALAGVVASSAQATASVIAGRFAQCPRTIRRIIWDLDAAPNPAGIARCFKDGAGLDGPGLTMIASDDAIRDGRLAGARQAAGDAGLLLHHVRVRLASTSADLARLQLPATSGEVILISIDLLAAHPETYHALTGIDGLGDAEHNTRLLLRHSRAVAACPGMPNLWIIPRITRRDEVYEELEGFYDRWLMEAGACVIDPLPGVVPGARIAPLPRPAWVEAMDAQTTARVLP
ncbi:MAG: DUF115 domain-containing protein [Phycisphaerales bacterium]|nr:DUF115 domain-containing protein [Phycisphaerales bacterium]